MSINPVEIELLKPGSFGFNKSLARLLGDSYRPNAISGALAEAVGPGSGGVVEGRINNFLAQYDINAGTAVLSWDIPEGDFTGFAVATDPSNEEFGGATYDASTNFVSITLNYAAYGVNFLTFSIRTFTNVGEDTTFGPTSTSDMYFIRKPENVKAGWDDVDALVNIGWTYPIDTTYVAFWTIKEDSLEFSQDYMDNTSTFISINQDPSWCSQTLQFYVVANYAEKVSDKGEAQFPVEIICNSEAPSLSSGTVNNAGNQITLVFDTEVFFTDGAGVTLTTSFGNFTLNYVSGEGTSTLVFTIDGSVFDGDTVSVVFSGTGIADGNGNVIQDGTFEITNHSNAINYGNNPGDDVVILIHPSNPFGAGQSFAFGGTTPIIVNQSTSIAFVDTNEVTISLWFNADALDEGLAGMGIFRLGNDDDSITVALTAAGDIFYGLAQDVVVYSPGDTSLLSGWHHLVLVGTQEFGETLTSIFNLYIDNVHVGVNEFGGGGTSFGNIVFGASADMLGFIGFVGREAEIRVYHNALDADAVNSFYTNTDLTDLNGLVVIYYDFSTETNSSERIFDRSPHQDGLSYPPELNVADVAGFTLTQVNINNYELDWTPVSDFIRIQYATDTFNWFDLTLITPDQSGPFSSAFNDPSTGDPADFIFGNTYFWRSRYEDADPASLTGPWTTLAFTSQIVNPAPPFNEVAPAVIGTAEIGQTLSVDDGTWDGEPTSFSYQWTRNDVDISGATSNTYVLVFEDADTTIQCNVTATNDLGDTEATSNGVTARYGFYVSADGDDAHAGTSPGTAVLTIAQAKTLRTSAGGAKSIGLRCGDTWRESYDETGTPLTTTIVGSYSTGATPIITGANIISSWTKTVGKTNVYESSNAQNTTGTNRSVVVVDGLLALTRATSIALCDSTAGSYFNATADGGTPMITYIHPVGDTDPNSDGRVYEVAVREVTLRLSANGKTKNVEVGPAMSNDGTLEIANIGAASNMICRYGTKHSTLLAGGVHTDIISLYVDNPISTELGIIPFVAYADDATGRSFEFDRCHFYEASRAITSAFFSHTNNDPTNSFLTGTLGGCVVRAAGGGCAFQPNAHTLTIENCCGVTGTTGSLLAVFSDAATINRLIGTNTVSAFMLVSALTTAPTVTYNNCAVWTGSAGRGIRVFSGTCSITRQTIACAGDNFQNQIDFQSGTGSLALNRSIVVGNNALVVPTGASYTGDNNVFVRPPSGIGPFASYHGSNFNLSTNMAGWRSATGQDAHSIVLTSTPMTGTMLNGDFRVNTSALTGAGHDGDAGPNDHWNFNTRAAVSGPPTIWPVIPTTLTEARSYIAAPASWTY